LKCSFAEASATGDNQNSPAANLNTQSILLTYNLLKFARLFNVARNSGDNQSFATELPGWLSMRLEFSGHNREKYVPRFAKLAAGEKPLPLRTAGARANRLPPQTVMCNKLYP
jgi:hypothetical protein